MERPLNFVFVLTLKYSQLFHLRLRYHLPNENKCACTLKNRSEDQEADNVIKAGTSDKCSGVIII